MKYLLSLCLLAFCLAACDTGGGAEPDHLLELVVRDGAGDPVADLQASICYGSCTESGMFGGVMSARSRLSVQWKSFTATVNGQDVILTWETASETNNAGFEVQVLTGESWNALGWVEGHGTTTEAQNYTFLAGAMALGTYTFRLKQIDFDGTFEYSDEVSAQIFGSEPIMLTSVYPNPFKTIAHMGFELQETQSVTMDVANLEGERVDLIDARVIEGHTLHLFQWTPDPGVLPGLYVYRVVGEVAADSGYAWYIGSEYPDGSSSFAFNIGRTGSNGIVHSDESSLFPYYAGVTEVLWTDEQGNAIGSISTGDITIVLKSDSGIERRFQSVLNPEGNRFELVWE